MRALVVYDSEFGNTRHIAEEIAANLRPRYTVDLLAAIEVSDIPEDIDLLVIGGPTHAHGASEHMKALFSVMGKGILHGIPTAAFDTRFQMPRWLTGSAGSAIARHLKRSGGEMVAEPESFFVARGKEAVLLPGEQERAAEWARALLAKLPAAMPT